MGSPTPQFELGYLLNNFGCCLPCCILPIADVFTINHAAYCTIVSLLNILPLLGVWWVASIIGEHSLGQGLKRLAAQRTRLPFVFVSILRCRGKETRWCTMHIRCNIYIAPDVSWHAVQYASYGTGGAFQSMASYGTRTFNLSNECSTIGDIYSLG